MLSYILYLINLFRLRWLLSGKKQRGRFNLYTPFVDLTKEEDIGLLANDSDWHNSTPNLSRNENVTIIASNNFDKSSLKLSLKWRPTSELSATTLLSRLSLQIGDTGYDYENVRTYNPDESKLKPGKITQFGSNGSSLKLYVLTPYHRYRIVFRGYMRKRNSPNERPVFVQLNLLTFITNKTYDFKEQFDEKFLAKQVAAQKPKCGLMGALNDLVLHDRHEHTIRVMGEYSIRDDSADSKPQIRKDELHLWGFYARHFIDDRTQKLRTKRILGHFENGRLFHIGVVENVDNKFDADQQFSFGYGCFFIGPATGPLTGIESVNWNEISSNTLSIKFSLAKEISRFSVEAKRRDSPSDLLDMKLNSASGWGVILINDSLDTGEELHAIQVSLREYEENLKSGKIIRPELSKDSKREFASKPLVVGIDEPDCLYPSLVGAKAASLAQLKLYSGEGTSQQSYTVPTAVMITRYAYEAIKTENPDLRLQVRSLEAQIGRGELDGLQLECDRLQAMVEKQFALPERCGVELKRLMSKQFKLEDVNSLDGRSFAVRSSSWGEDEDDMSAAGQLSTVLEVRGFENLAAAVMKCFASKFGHINIEYKRQHGLPLDLPMAVVVQEMIECDKAGVMFTCDPTNGDPDRLMITANYGLGESVVSGQTDPDTISVRRQDKSGSQDEADFSIEQTQVGGKKVILSGRADGLDGVEEVAESGQQFDRSKCCLNEQEINRLSRCGHKLGLYFRCPRDIEWGFKGDVMYLFQSRPITGLDAFTDYELSHECDSPSRAEIEFTTRANVNEVMPYPLTPIQSSLGIKIWPALSAKFFGKLKRSDLADYTMTCSPDFLQYNHYVFFALRGGSLFNFATMKGQKRDLVSSALEVGMFGHLVENEELCEQATEMLNMNFHNSSFQELRFDWHTFGSRYQPFKCSDKVRKQLRRLRRDVHSLRYAKSGANMKGLHEQLLEVYSRCEESGNHHLACTIISSKVNFALLQMLSKYIKDPVQLHMAFSKFLSSSPNVLSAEIPRRIDKMAKLIKKRGAKDVENFVHLTPGDALKYVSNDFKSELAKEFDSFMVKFGHRCYNEFEIGQRAWREKPELLMEMLQANVKKYLSTNSNNNNNNNNNMASAAAATTKHDDDSDEERKHLTTDEIIGSLDANFSFYDKLLTKYLLAPRCQMFVGAREQTKDGIIEFHDVLRDAARLLARELRQNNRIPDEDLFYYLLYEEIGPLIREPQPSVVVQAAKRRRNIESMKGAWRFDEIIRGHKMVPLHLKETKEMSEKLANAPRLVGTTASSGRVQAKVCIVQGYDELGNVQPGDILVTYSTDIAFSPIFPLISGVITEVGGLISHGAVIAREYGLPSVIGIENVTKILKTGEEIILDANEGTIIRLSQQQESP